MKQEDFLFSHTNRNLNSAKLIIDTIKPFIEHVSTILDLGGGVGSWTRALNDLGYNNTQLVDHPQVDKELLLIADKNNFIPLDLEMALPAAQKVDLILCIEVLEHFKEKRALELLDFITSSTDLIFFSAAIPGQSGLGHINCQRHRYWHQKFKDRGFLFYDGFKYDLLQNPEIHYWLRQNCFFYYNSNSSHLFQSNRNLTTEDFELVSNRILERKMGIWEYIRMAPKVFTRKQTWG